VAGNTQVFQKDEAPNVYGTVVLKNLYWPGWITIGYVPYFLFRKQASLISTWAMATNGRSQVGTNTKTPLWPKKQKT
jgi:hypothetical protein